MASQRKAIRAAVVAALKDQTAAADRVHPNRILPLRKNELPVIAVYTLEESIDEDRSTSGYLSRELELVVEAWVAVPVTRVDVELTDDPVDDAMDDLADEIEIAMEATITASQVLGGLAADLELRSTDLVIAIDGDRQMGLVILTYGVTYQTSIPLETSELDDFEEVHATHNILGEVHEDNDAEDQFTVEASP